MIRKVILHNWRAYQDLDVSFREGTTFVVARNGIGKTSLIEAAQWALFGGRAAVDRPVPRRLGADDAFVEVTVQLPESEQLLVVKRTRRVQRVREVEALEATMGGKPVASTELNGLLETAWGSPIDFVARSAFLNEGLRDLDADLDLRMQLCRLLGITDLDELSATFDREHTRREGELRKQRSVSAAEIERREQAKSELSEVQIALEAAADRLAHARVQASEATARLEAIRQTRRSAEQARARAAEFDDIARRAVLALGRHVEASELLVTLERYEEELQRALEELGNRRATLGARIGLIEDALTQLNTVDASADCPVCRRPLGPAEHARAATAHADELQSLRAEVVGIDDRQVSSMRETVRSLVRELLQVGPKPESFDVEGEGEEARATEAVAAAQADLETAAADERERQLRIQRLREEAGELDAARQANQRLVDAYRESLLLQATSSGLRRTINVLVEEHLEPLTEAVGERWNALFADRPNLQLNAEGVMSRMTENGELPFKAFSGGERMAAAVFLRLVAAAAVSGSGFCWIDEPLEHLDPTARRLVGGMLSTGPRAVGLRQVVVTTYEQDLVRRLADAGDAEVMYVRTPAGEPVEA